MSADLTIRSLINSANCPIKCAFSSFTLTETNEKELQFHHARRKEKDLEISWLCHFISQLCKLIFWYRPVYRDTCSSTFTFSGVEFERTGDIPGWNDWTSQGAFDQQVRLTRFGESRDVRSGAQEEEAGNPEKSSGWFLLKRPPPSWG